MTNRCCYSTKAIPECRLNEPEDQLIEFQGKNYCQFHLPLENETEKSVKAGWDQARKTEFSNTIHNKIDTAIDSSEPLWLNGVVFPGAISFERYNIEKPLSNISFQDTVFGGPAQFNGVSFSKNANFNGARFLQGAGFSKVNFHEAGDFRGAIFKGITQFQSNRFLFKSGPCALFDDAVFREGASFVNAIFLGHAKFLKTKFCKSADFSYTGSGGENDSDHIIGSVWFDDAVFYNEVYFRDRAFRNWAWFRRAVFEMPPDFLNVEFCNDVSFRGAKFRGFKNSDNTADQRYSMLKMEMRRVGAARDEERFFVLEQKSIARSPLTPFCERMQNFVYEYLSNYGGSIFLPFFWLSVLFTVASIMYGDTWPAIRELFLPFYQLRLTARQDASIWYRLIWITHSSVNMGLIALILLAIRRRFRMA